MNLNISPRPIFNDDKESQVLTRWKCEMCHVFKHVNIFNLGSSLIVNQVEHSVRNLDEEENLRHFICEMTVLLCFLLREVCVR
jgi:hypothetical protein